MISQMAGTPEGMSVGRDQVVHQVGSSESIDRRRFLRNAAVITAAVPTIMTLTAPGAAAASCSATTNRNVDCACTTDANCSATGATSTTVKNCRGANGLPAPGPSTCQTCKAPTAATSSTTCTAVGNNNTGTDNTCCNRTCIFKNATGFSCT